VEKNVAFNPTNVGLFDAAGAVFGVEYIPQSIQQLLGYSGIVFSPRFCYNDLSLTIFIIDWSLKP
jgi:hypothetical protein